MDTNGYHTLSMQHKNYAITPKRTKRLDKKVRKKHAGNIRIGASKLSQNKKVPAAKVARKELLYIR